jgi:hypothetical protein
VDSHVQVSQHLNFTCQVLCFAMDQDPSDASRLVLNVLVSPPVSPSSKSKEQVFVGLRRQITLRRSRVVIPTCGRFPYIEIASRDQESEKKRCDGRLDAAVADCSHLG